MLNRFLLIIIVSLYSLSCSVNKKSKDKIGIKLEQIINTNVAFNGFFDEIPFSSLDDKFPKYYKTQMHYEEAYVADSTMVIATLNTDFKKFKYDLFKNGFIEREKFDDLKIDSLKEKVKPEQRQLIVAVSYKGNKQILTVDANNNKDFSDDSPIEFDEDFSLSLNNKLPVYAFNYKKMYDNEQIVDFNRHIIVYPDTNSLRLGNTDDELEKKPKLVVKFKDYWKGRINIQNIDYDIAVQGGYKPFLTVLIKPDSLKFSKNDIFYNENFSYKIKDTVKVANQLFVIDNISNDVSKLTLKKINVSHNTFFGNKIGYTISNYSLTSLNDRTTTLSEIKESGKKYTLLDFWGTWCSPCKELTPELKRIRKEYSKRLAIVGIALDANVKSVNDYVDKNKMNWFHAFIARENRKGTIIEELQIKSYPTFMLLDNKNKIIYRGVGSSALKKIENIIK
jgi:thiol-disulfide isomerase/thioredoxin